MFLLLSSPIVQQFIYIIDKKIELPYKSERYHKSERNENSFGSFEREFREGKFTFKVLYIG